MFFDYKSPFLRLFREAGGIHVGDRPPQRCHRSISRKNSKIAIPFCEAQSPIFFFIVEIRLVKISEFVFLGLFRTFFCHP
jgi:hypothetical protein